MDEIKKQRGNPNWIKKKTENNTQNTMAEEKDEPKKELNEKGEDVSKASTQETPPPAPDTLPEDLFSDKMPGEEILPLDGIVKEKSYAALPSDATETPSTSTDSKPSGDGTSSAPATSVVPPPTPEEINSQAEATVKLMIRGYEKLHSLGRWIGKVDQGNLTQMHAKGKINLELVLPLGKKSITVQDFFSEYNMGIDENITVSQEFKDNITPPLKRICIKRNWLLSDEGTVLVFLGEDLSTKVSMLVGLKRSANLVLEACKSMMAAQQEKKEKKPQQTASVEEHPQPTEETSDWHEPEVVG